MTRYQRITKALLAGLVLLGGLLLQLHQPAPALAAPATGRIYIGTTAYDTLELAIAAATAGDTLTLTGGDLEVTTPVTIPGAKNLTLDLGGNSLVSHIDDGAKRMLTTSGAGAFTVKNGRLSAVDTDGNGLTSGAISSYAADLTVEGVEATGFHTTRRGGVVHIGSQAQQVNIAGNHFHNNSAVEHGGAISIENMSPQAVATITGNRILSNKVTTSSSHSYGGGISVTGNGRLEILDNEVADNSVSASDLEYGFHWSHGGGIAIMGSISNTANIKVTMAGNIISRNEAQLYGGGLYLFLYGGSPQVELQLLSGIFEDNHSDYAGGAIDYSVHGQPTLVLKNALFTENTARRGGAIWLCPTSKTTTYSTLGGAIVGNNLDERVVPTIYTPAGPDVRFEGSDTDLVRTITDNDPAYHLLTMYDRTFLGDKVNWYRDNPLNRYEQGDAPLSSDEYIGRSTSIGLYGDILSPDGWKERHESEAQLVFTGNTAQIRGGAISANSDIQIGEQGDVSVLVTKEWLDLNGEPLTTGLPEFVYARLIRIDEHGGEYPLEAVRLSAATNWQHLFDRLPGKGLVGNEVLNFTYEVREEAAPLGFDASDIHPTPTAGAAHNYETLITNQQQHVTIKGSKTWDDNNNQDGKRPTSITIHLLQDHVEVATRVVTADDGWAWDFGTWPLYVNETGELVNYAVTEDAGPDYSTTVQGYSLTNSHTPGQTSVQVTKAWFDGNNQDGVRPQSVTVELVADGRHTGKTITLSEANHWTGTFTHLDMYHNQGQLIVYTVEEVPVRNGYTLVTTGDAIHGYILTNTRTPDTVDISGRKTWDDQDDTYGVRPDQITINLYANGLLVPGKSQIVVPDANGTWAWRWEGLPKNRNGQPIHYEVGEEKIADYVVAFPDYATAPLNAYDITNSYLPDKFNIPVRKFWADQNNQEGLRPASVVIKLYANGEDTGHTVTLTEANHWHDTFHNLAKYDAAGDPIRYRLEESSTLWLYRVAYRPARDMTVDQLNHVDARSGATIENHRVPETVMVEGAKTWVDGQNQDGKRPASITVRLHKNGTEMEARTVTAADGWAWRFVKLPKYENGTLVSYTLTEDAVPGYTTQVTGYNITNTHTPETVEVAGAKTWEDGENQDGLRPDSITVRLYGDGVEIASKTVTAADNWTWAFTDLPAYDNGQLIAYIITEDAVPGYTTQITGYNITNTHTPETVTVEGRKTWADGENQDGLRPDSIVVRVHGNGVEVASKTVTATDDWAWTFADLPAYENGQLIAYTLTEDAVPGYTTQITGYNITNIHTPETVTVEGRKTWNDNNDQSGIRPSSITLRLQANGVEVASKTVTADDNWAWAFTDLPKHEAGQPITYTLTEDAVAPYTTLVRGYDLVNSYTPPKPPDPPTPPYPTLRVPLVVGKALQGGVLKGGEFTFQLKDKTGKVIAEATNAADGTISFPDRTFGNVISNYILTITEVPGTDKNITYDSTVYTLSYTTRAVDGQLEVSVTVHKNGIPYGGDIVFTNGRKLPPTGDQAWRTIALLVVASLALLGGGYVLRRRAHHR